MTTAYEAQRNGSWWLFTLKYGFEKAHQPNQSSKLSFVRAELKQLLHTHVVLTALVNENTQPIDGRLGSYDLINGTVTVTQDKDVTTIPFCEVVPDESMLMVRPLVTMQADLEYKF